jgi:hypothetical protein
LDKTRDHCGTYVDSRGEARGDAANEFLSIRDLLTLVHFDVNCVVEGLDRSINVLDALSALLV